MEGNCVCIQIVIADIPSQSEAQLQDPSSQFRPHLYIKTQMTSEWDTGEFFQTGQFTILGKITHFTRFLKPIIFFFLL